MMSTTLRRTSSFSHFLHLRRSFCRALDTASSRRFCETRTNPGLVLLGTQSRYKGCLGIKDRNSTINGTRMNGRGKPQLKRSHHQRAAVYRKRRSFSFPTSLLSSLYELWKPRYRRSTQFAEGRPALTTLFTFRVLGWEQVRIPTCRHVRDRVSRPASTPTRWPPTTCSSDCAIVHLARASRTRPMQRAKTLRRSVRVARRVSWVVWCFSELHRLTSSLSKLQEPVTCEQIDARDSRRKATLLARALHPY